jgi:hypothetical protein
MIQLIPYWQSAWRLWSVRFAAFGTLLYAYFLAFPDAAVTAWQMLPEDIKSFVPIEWQRYVTLIVFLLTLLARLIQQNKASVVIETKMAEKVATGEVEKITLFKPADKSASSE